MKRKWELCKNALKLNAIFIFLYEKLYKTHKMDYMLFASVFKRIFNKKLCNIYNK